jgi:hypothetical protein
MLRDCLERADAAAWRAAVGRFPFWHVAYHVLFFTDLYLSPNEAAFRPQPFHVEDSNFLGQQPWPPFKKVVADRPYEKAALLDYLAACRSKAVSILAAETEATLAGPGGFDWLPLTRLELHLYNLRHLQHHTGQFAAMLRREHGESVAWVRSERP